MTTAHRTPHGLPCGDTLPSAARLSCRASFSPRPPPQRGAHLSPSLPPEDGLRLPKCRSIRPRPGLAACAGCCNRLLFIHRRPVPRRVTSRRSHLGLTHGLGQKPSVLAKVPPYPGGGLRFPSPAAAASSAFTTSLTRASAAGRAVHHH